MNSVLLENCTDARLKLLHIEIVQFWKVFDNFCWLEIWKLLQTLPIDDRSSEISLSAQQHEKKGEIIREREKGPGLAAIMNKNKNTTSSCTTVTICVSVCPSPRWISSNPTLVATFCGKIPRDTMFVQYSTGLTVLYCTVIICCYRT